MMRNTTQRLLLLVATLLLNQMISTCALATDHGEPTALPEIDSDATNDSFVDATRRSLQRKKKKMKRGEHYNRSSPTASRTHVQNALDFMSQYGKGKGSTTKSSKAPSCAGGKSGKDGKAGKEGSAGKDGKSGKDGSGAGGKDGKSGKSGFSSKSPSMEGKSGKSGNLVGKSGKTGSSKSPSMEGKSGGTSYLGGGSGKTGSSRSPSMLGGKGGYSSSKSPSYSSSKAPSSYHGKGFSKGYDGAAGCEEESFDFNEDEIPPPDFAPPGGPFPPPRTLIPSVSVSPSDEPSTMPSSITTLSPSVSAQPSKGPSPAPSTSSIPTMADTAPPSTSLKPSTGPSSVPSTSVHPSVNPSPVPTVSAQPSAGPSPAPSTSSVPTMADTSPPSVSLKPSTVPSPTPSISSHPSANPSPAPSVSNIPTVPIEDRIGRPTECSETRPEISLCVSLDQSGSLDDIFTDGAQRVGQFGFDLISSIEVEVENSNFALNTFKTNLEERTAALGSATVAQQLVLPFSNLRASGNTNIQVAIENCHTQLDGPDQKSDRVMVLVGDGKPTTCTSTDPATPCDNLEAATAAADAAKAAGILVITVFIGDPRSQGFENFQDFATEGPDADGSGENGGGYAFRIDTPTLDELALIISKVLDSVVCGITFTFPPTVTPRPTVAPTAAPP